MGFIQFEEQTAEEIFRYYRAFSTNIGIKVHFLPLGTKLIHLNRMENPLTVQLSYKNYRDTDYFPGMVKYDKIKKLLFIKCKEGWIGVSNLQIEGKNSVTAQAFAATHQLIAIKYPSNGFRFISVNKKL